MKAVLKRTAIVIVVGVVLVQFLPLKKNQDATVGANDITKVYPVPDNVHALLQKSCYDCHSNNTTYPWYSHVQPIGWWLNDHVGEGKHHLNFSEFGTYSTKRKIKKLKEVAGTINEGEMPLSSYTLIHTNAKLSNEEKTLVTTWAASLAQQLSDTAKAQ